LHQALEAKERVPVQKESRTVATITLQNYFRMYEKISGMSGTVLTSAEEFKTVYNLEAVALPTNKPLIRKDLADRIYKTQEAKLKALMEEVKTRHQTGQPILIGAPANAVSGTGLSPLETVEKYLRKPVYLCSFKRAKKISRKRRRNYCSSW